MGNFRKKLNMFAVIIISVIILAMGIIVIFQIRRNQQANEIIIDKCFENFDKEGKVVVKKVFGHQFLVKKISSYLPLTGSIAPQ